MLTTMFDGAANIRIAVTQAAVCSPRQRTAQSQSVAMVYIARNTPSHPRVSATCREARSHPQGLNDNAWSFLRAAP